ncbi:MAG TPA: CGNR zinc finger domain-containing protein [Gaiellaceae bacterium]|nr:CGNR zinc finger domain-containing protein [Gaiellaceae bacterium]
MILPRERDSTALAVALVNTWDVLNDPPELLDDVETLRLVLEAFSLDEAAGQASESDLAPVRRVRDRLRRAFEAKDDERAVLELNGLAREAGAVPQLEREGGAWAFRYGSGSRPLATELAGRTAVALLGVIEREGWGRFGLCAAAPCCCVFVDRSRNRSRRYCCELCADRATQAAARRRRKAQAV